MTHHLLLPSNWPSRLLRLARRHAPRWVEVAKGRFHRRNLLHFRGAPAAHRARRAWSCAEPCSWRWTHARAPPRPRGAYSPPRAPLRHPRTASAFSLGVRITHRTARRPASMLPRLTICGTAITPVRAVTSRCAAREAECVYPGDANHDFASSQFTSAGRHFQIIVTPARQRWPARASLCAGHAA